MTLAGIVKIKKTTFRELKKFILKITMSKKIKGKIILSRINNI